MHSPAALWFLTVEVLGLNFPEVGLLKQPTDSDFLLEEVVLLMVVVVVVGLMVVVVVVGLMVVVVVLGVRGSDILISAILWQSLLAALTSRSHNVSPFLQAYIALAVVSLHFLMSAVLEI